MKIENPSEWPTQHRPYPPPDEPWIMYQEWHELLFAHWAVPFEAVRPLVPEGLLLDTFDGKAWVGVVPFYIHDLHARLTPPIPGTSDFPEMNVRTYVTRDSVPGVWFFSLDAGNPLAVAAARALFHLPYYNADMTVVTEEETTYYQSHRTHSGAPEADFVGSYAPTGEEFNADKESLEYFLTERYCLYSQDSRGALYRCDIHHPPWPLQPAQADIQRNTTADAAGIRLPDDAPLLHFSTVQRMVVYPIHSL